MEIKCKDKAELIKYQIKNKIDEYHRVLFERPKFLIIQVGDNEASNRYVRGKINDCKFVGIAAELLKLSEEITTSDVCTMIKAEQNLYDAIMVQFPLPDHIDKEKVLACIPPEKDVDGLVKNSCFTPCTPLGVMCILHEILELDLTNQNVLLIGRSELVGKPLIELLLKSNATLTICHSKTSKYQLNKCAESSDIIISAVGKENLLDKSTISSGTYVIDVGINVVKKFINGEWKDRLVGDIPDGAHYFKTPVPGGVGLMTRAMLLKNILKAYEMKNGFVK